MIADERPKQGEKKGFLAQIIERIDKAMEEKARKSPCCGSDPHQKKGSSCC